MSTFPFTHPGQFLAYSLDRRGINTWFTEAEIGPVMKAITASIEAINGLGVFQLVEINDAKASKIHIQFQKMDGDPQDPTVTDMLGHCLTKGVGPDRHCLITIDGANDWAFTWWQSVNPFGRKIHFQANLMHELLHALGAHHTPKGVLERSLMDTERGGSYCTHIPRYDKNTIHRLYGLL